ncbi:flagellar protein FlgN [Alkalicoccobacillus gibsonii]|uniref:flagellar protein FlgN n=1 Tax=Alkalicoccobacillus gibsonii TaxID=79881 RepID=UPI0035129D93
MLIQELTRRLQDLIDLHQQLLFIAEKKKESLIKQDIKTLQAAVQDESKIVRRIQLSEDNRVKAVKALLHSLHLSPVEDTLSYVLEHVNGEERALLTKLTHKLADTLSTIKMVNDQNQQLIQDALQYVHVSLDLLTPSAEDFQYNAKHQELEKSSSYSTFDSKA